MSATMDVDLFSQYFNKSPVLYLEGRQHPIQIYYTKQPQSDYLHAALVSIFQIHQVRHVSPLCRQTVSFPDVFGDEAHRVCALDNHHNPGVMNIFVIYSDLWYP